MSINMIRSGPSELPGTSIEIGMQSGDVIVIESDVQEHDVHWLDGEDST